jgi:predicted component of type VI protein secretion system
MLAQLISLGEDPSILLDKPILLIGRDPECDIQIDSRKISRRHCCVAQVNDYLVVRDLGSTNGIRINGTRVQEGNLVANDELTIGGSSYRVSWEVPVIEARRDSDPRRQLEPANARPLADDEDFFLESSDEPVALPDRGNSHRPPAARQTPGPESDHRTKPPEPTPHEIIKPRQLERLVPSDESLPQIIPDEIGLVPITDAKLPKAKNA